MVSGERDHLQRAADGQTALPRIQIIQENKPKSNRISPAAQGAVRAKWGRLFSGRILLLC